MKTLKIIIKGVLLYVTTLLSIIYICGIDSIIESDYFILLTLMVVVLIYSCYKCISYREFYILSLNRWFNNLTKE